jgi:anti-sigma B factor antagonist
MKVKTRTYDNLNIAVLELHGKFIGGSETDELKQRANDLFEQGCHKLIIDMDDVHYMNSTGIGALIHIYTHFKNENGKIRLCRVRDSAQNIFVITQLVKVFDIDDTIEDSLINIQKN